MLSYSPIIQASLLVVLYLLWTFWCLRGAILTTNAKTLVAYASASGQAKTLALHLGQRLGLPVLSLNQLDGQDIGQLQRLYIVASTYGDGEAPDNGRLFTRTLKRLKKDELQGLEFALLGLGDSSYAQFCAFALTLENALLQAGAKALFAPILADKLEPTALRRWHEALGLLDEAPILAKDEASFALPLISRQCLNAGSQGAPLMQLDFSASSLPPWRSGDIARLVLPEGERDYSIASLPEESKLRVLVREKRTPEGQLGLGSGFLCHRLALGEKAYFKLKSNPSFYAAEPDIPMILIGNGTGLSGLIAHIKARALGSRNWLIYGERSPEQDLIWHNELGGYLKNQRLTELDLSFSRHATAFFPEGLYGRTHRGYVQQVLYAQKERLLAWLEERAVIYLCGSKEGMAADVERALQELLGEEKLQELIRSERLKRDVY